MTTPPRKPRKLSEPTRFTAPARRTKHSPGEPQPIPPDEHSAGEVRHIVALLDVISNRAERAGRRREPVIIQTLMNDLVYRLKPLFNLTACSACDGYRDGDAYTSPKRCIHIPPKEPPP